MNIDPSIGHWKWMMSAPWDAELLYEFRYQEIEIKQPQPFPVSPDFLPPLKRHLSLLLHLTEYCGFQNTWARLAKTWNQEGIPIQRAWMGAALGGQLALAGIHDIIPQIFSLEDRDHLSLSPLHFWALSESCIWIREDLIPQCEESGGLPFGECTLIHEDLEAIESRFSPIRDVLEGEFEPYARLRLVTKIDSDENKFST